MSRYVLGMILCTVAACANPFAPGADEPAAPEATASDQPPGQAGGPPYAYPPEYHQQFMDGCRDEGGTDDVCECVYTKLQWRYTAEQVANDVVTEDDVSALVTECLQGS